DAVGEAGTDPGWNASESTSRRPQRETGDRQRGEGRQRPHDGARRPLPRSERQWDRPALPQAKHRERPPSCEPTLEAEESERHADGRESERQDQDDTREAEEQPRGRFRAEEPAAAEQMKPAEREQERR